MKITKEQLLNSDWSALFTHDPATFFEAVLINILWNDKEPSSIDHNLIARQKYIFERWFKYFEANLRHDIEQELELVKTKATADYQNGYLAGQIQALVNLPMRYGALGRSVDIREVTETLRKLKSEVKNDH